MHKWTNSLHLNITFGGIFSLPSHRTDNGEHILQLYAANVLFLYRTKLQRNSRQTTIWHIPGSSMRWSRIGHIALARFRTKLRGILEFLHELRSRTTSLSLRVTISLTL